MRHDIYEGVLFYIMKGIKPNYAELGRQYNCKSKNKLKNIMKQEKKMN
ncbi:hypothetical protein ACVPOY_13240 [Staphylococcus aureus]